MEEKKMSTFKTEQENFWSGEFGNEYLNRNQSDQLCASNLAFFSRILSNTKNIDSVIELGANIGLNVIALKQLLGSTNLAAVEINSAAVEKLNKIRGLSVFNQSIHEFSSEEKYDLVFTKGVLIHLDPNSLPQVYEKMYHTSSKYICIAEYYNPSPLEISYRGHSEKLFKRDFAGEMMDQFKDLHLVDYGFAYHRDPVFPQDDISWFLLEK
jgi:spore coat polysaccharide biosynthesis protein SpsF